MVCWCHYLFPFETKGASRMGGAFIEVANYIYVLIGSFEALVP